MMSYRRLILIGFILVLIGAVLPFLIVIRLVESTFLLNAIAMIASTVGVFLCVIVTAMYVGDNRRKDDYHDYHDY